MGKFLLTCAIVLLYLNCSLGQFALLKELDKSEYIVSGHQFENQTHIISFNSDNNELKIRDHKLIIKKKITFPSDETYNSVLVSYLSKNVFNNDDKFEFIIQTITSDSKVSFMIMNDAGDILMDSKEKNTFLIESNQENLIVVRTVDYDSNEVPVKISYTDEIYKTGGVYRKLKY